ncbi:uncharacterized protein PV06_04409 [Exophiala oligosperma]|uniref:Zn(2)-C6 fungal-type domain-containing protein n=1 Tax=Exophiala oligosperma TaxID=215243 RepID=A0A0D2ATY5_9EURO|nr:uncharacterized protein PV06_04409 [Exophiala oligosperma]KIW43291.1 hypothetical protein PV06_04409 [Exophiala oligosperma]
MPRRDIHATLNFRALNQYDYGNSERTQPRKLRGGNACLQCRKQKSRCDQGIPRCSHCVEKQWTCIYAATGNAGALDLEIHNPHRNLEMETIPTQSTTDLQTPGAHDDFVNLEQNISETPKESNAETSIAVGPDTLTRNLVEEFFTLLYPLPSFSFLHPEITQERLMEGSLDEALVFAICGITELQRRSDSEAQGRSVAWISKSEELIWQHLEKPSMARLQALVLCVAYRIDTGSSHRAFMLAGVASRSATAMRLNHERHDLDPTSNEVRRRTLWSLKVLEQYFSIGLPEYELLPFENIYLQLPSREDCFQESDQPLHLEGGAYSLFVKLTSLRRDTMKFNRSIALFDQPFPQLLKLTRSLDSELLHLRDQMPAGSDMAAASVAQFISTPWLARHLVMQLSWHQCRCDLYRLFLPGYPEAAPALVLADLDLATTQTAVQVCAKSALSIIEILSEVNSQCSHSPLMEYDSAICGYHACRLILFLAGCQSEMSSISKEYAISRGELCLAAMKRFFRRSAPVGPILKDLERLISTCSTSSDNWAQLIFRSTPTERSRDPLLSQVAMAKQRLAIHSLLRQAEFEDGESSIVASSSGPAVQPSPNDNTPPPSYPVPTYVPQQRLEFEQVYSHFHGDLFRFSTQTMEYP